MLAGPACTNFAALPGLLRWAGGPKNRKHAVAHFQKRLKAFCNNAPKTWCEMEPARCCSRLTLHHRKFCLWRRDAFLREVNLIYKQKRRIEQYKLQNGESAAERMLKNI